MLRVFEMRSSIPGDHILVSWILWWDYHRPLLTRLNLFPFQPSSILSIHVAFSENCYGIALLFFPLFLLGCRPLTVHAVAMFFGFAACGYGAFRLARTLTGLLCRLPGYGHHLRRRAFSLSLHVTPALLVCGWIPLLLEALVLFVSDSSVNAPVLAGGCLFHDRSGDPELADTIGGAVRDMRRRAAHPSWSMAKRPVMATRCNRRRRSRPRIDAIHDAFTISYPGSMGFVRSIDEVRQTRITNHWLSVDAGTSFGRDWAGINDGWRFKLFPGLLPILLSLVALVQNASSGTKITAYGGAPTSEHVDPQVRYIGPGSSLFFRCRQFDSIAPTTATQSSSIYPEIALTLLLVTIVAPTVPGVSHTVMAWRQYHLIQTNPSERRSDTFWIGRSCFLWDFALARLELVCYRILYDIFLPFRSMRVPTRGAMIAYLGLSLLAGLAAFVSAKF